MNNFIYPRKLFFILSFAVLIISCKSNNDLPAIQQMGDSLPFIEVLNNEKFSDGGKMLSRLTLKINHKESSPKLQIKGFYILCDTKEYEPLDFIKDELNGFTIFDKYILILDEKATENCREPKVLIK